MRYSEGKKATDLVPISFHISPRFKTRVLITIKDTPDMQYQIAFKTDCSSLLYHIAVLVERIKELSKAIFLLSVHRFFLTAAS